MTILDYLILIVIGASFASGAARGILKAVFSLISAIVGLIAAAYLYGYAAGLFIDLVETRRAANLAGFALIFLIAIIVGSLMSRWLRTGLRRARLDWVDHVLGAGFGLLRGWLLCSVVYLALTAFPVRIEAVEQAAFSPALLEGTRVIAAVTSSELREKFFDGYARVKKLWDKKN
jgi:membrane protein required for colicin V production